jgi:hypothetical protein
LPFGGAGFVHDDLHGVDGCERRQSQTQDQLRLSCISTVAATKSRVPGIAGYGPIDPTRLCLNKPKAAAHDD